jgi:menaquinone-9 beta-reductase
VNGSRNSIGPRAIATAAAYDMVIVPRLRQRYDVVVVGARCAGAATGMLLARAGLSVLLLDRARDGTDTLSTHALMRAGVLRLHHWGILGRLQQRGTPVVRTTSFHYGDEVVAIELKPRDGVDGLYAPRRLVIDPILVEAAREAGAEVVHCVAVTDLVRAHDGRVTGVVVKDEDGTASEIAAGLVVGADGMRSTVAARLEAPAYRSARHTTAVIFSYFAGLPNTGYHWYYRPGVSAGFIPTDDGQTCVFAAFPPARFPALRDDLHASHQRLLRECDTELAAQVAGAERKERYRGFGGLLGYIRPAAGPGWALVGDAAYFKDPLTAHGMTDALVDAGSLAAAIAAGTDLALQTYHRERDERILTFFDVTDAIASFEWDLATLKGLHLQLSDEMKREASLVLASHAARPHATPASRSTDPPG